MARFTPTHEPPDFPDTELPPEEPAPGGRQMLRMFIPVAIAIVVFIGALLLVIKFLVIPALERGDPAAQTRGVATLGALQTQQAVTRSQQGLTPQTTPQPANTQRPATTAQPASQPTLASGAAVVAPATQANTAPTTVIGPTTAETNTSPVSTQVTQPATSAALPTANAAAATPATASLATPVQLTLETGNAPTQVPSLAAPVALPTVDPVAHAEVIQAYSHYWE
jgi:cytoskeletal protein RodZ